MNIPESVVITTSVYIDFTKQCSVEINSLLNNLDETNIETTSSKIIALVNALDPKMLKSVVSDIIKADKKYAVRSSAVQEDLKSFSFAGVYSSDLNVIGIEQVTSSIINCYKSLFSPRALAYHIQTGLGNDDYMMAVLVQEMVEPDFSGVLFSCNAQEANDQEMVIEYIDGYGEDLVNGKVTPNRICIPWFGELSGSLFENALLYSLREDALKIAQYLGYPVDIEFCINDSVNIVQVRPITNLNTSVFKEVWTNANFRDGLAKEPATPLMNSLYKYIWEAKYEKYLVSSKLIKRSEIDKSYMIYMANAYWNVSLAKNAMLKVISFKERSFDQDLGIEPTYQGDGRVVKVSPKSILQMLRTAPSVSSISKSFDKTKLINHQKYLDEITFYYKGLRYEDEIASRFLKLTKESYFNVEGDYFWLIFINTVKLSLYQGYITKELGDNRYLDTISNIDDISHMRPFVELQEIVNQIKQDKESYEYWLNTDVDTIRNDQNNNYYLNYIPEFRWVVRKYGYHSLKELRIDYPNYAEDSSSLIMFMKEQLVSSQTESSNIYLQLLEELKQSRTNAQYQKIKAKIEKMRESLWWREEYKDLSNRYYHLIRCYSLRLAKQFIANNVIDDIDDFWYAKITDIWSYLANQMTASQLRSQIAENKIYYLSYKNIAAPNEIGNSEKLSNVTNGQLTGTGCTSAVATGKVVIINSQEDILKINEKVIVVATNLEPNFVSKINFIEGIITESGGILCHYAVVARELNIPCVVNVKGALKLLKDEMFVTVDSSSGNIKIEVV